MAIRFAGELVVSQVSSSAQVAGLARGLVSHVGWSRRWAGLAGGHCPVLTTRAGSTLSASVWTAASGSRPSRPKPSPSIPGKAIALVTVQIGDGHP